MNQRGECIRSREYKKKQKQNFHRWSGHKIIKRWHILSRGELNIGKEAAERKN